VYYNLTGNTMLSVDNCNKKQIESGTVAESRKIKKLMKLHFFNLRVMTSDE